MNNALEISTNNKESIQAGNLLGGDFILHPGFHTFGGAEAGWVVEVYDVELAEDSDTGEALATVWYHECSHVDGLAFTGEGHSTFGLHLGAFDLVTLFSQGFAD